MYLRSFGTLDVFLKLLKIGIRSLHPCADHSVCELYFCVRVTMYFNSFRFCMIVSENAEVIKGMSFSLVM